MPEVRSAHFYKIMLRWTLIVGVIALALVAATVTALILYIVFTTPVAAASSSSSSSSSSASSSVPVPSCSLCSSANFHPYFLATSLGADNRAYHRVVKLADVLPAEILENSSLPIYEACETSFADSIQLKEALIYSTGSNRITRTHLIDADPEFRYPALSSQFTPLPQYILPSSEISICCSDQNESIIMQQALSRNTETYHASLFYDETVLAYPYQLTSANIGQLDSNASQVGTLKKNILSMIPGDFAVYFDNSYDFENNTYFPYNATGRSPSCAVN